MKYLKKLNLINENKHENLANLIDVVFSNGQLDDIKTFISLLKDIYIIDENGHDLLQHSIVYDMFEIFTFLIDEYNWNINNYRIYLEYIVDYSDEKYIKFIISRKDFDINTKIYNKPMIFDIYDYFGANVVLFLLEKHPDYDFTIKYDGDYFFKSENSDDEIDILINSNNKKLSNFIKKAQKVNKFNL